MSCARHTCSISTWTYRVFSFLTCFPAKPCRCRFSNSFSERIVSCTISHPQTHNKRKAFSGPRKGVFSGRESHEENGDGVSRGLVWVLHLEELCLLLSLQLLLHAVHPPPLPLLQQMAAQQAAALPLRPTLSWTAGCTVYTHATPPSLKYSTSPKKKHVPLSVVLMFPSHDGVWVG